MILFSFWILHRQLADNLLSGSIPASLGSGQSFSNPKKFLLV
jgi:hypothetical protein